MLRRAFGEGELVVLRKGEHVIMHAGSDSRVMLLGGAPLDGARFIEWNFVASSQARSKKPSRPGKTGASPRFLGTRSSSSPCLSLVARPGLGVSPAAPLLLQVVVGRVVFLWCSGGVVGGRVSFRLRSGKKGIELRLHELEATIMDVVWSKKLARFSVSEVLEVLEKQRDIAYTTVMTTLARLHDKSLLLRERDGKRYLYSSRLSREQFLESTAREVLDGAVGGTQAMALLVEKVSEASSRDLDELESLIKRRRKELAS